MADYGLDVSDHGKRKYELKTITYDKRSKVRPWHIIVSMGLVWMGLIINAHLDFGTVCPVCSVWPMVWKTVSPTVSTMIWPKVCLVWPLILTRVWRMVWPTVWTRVWRRVCSVWPLGWTTVWRMVWPMVWTMVWPRVCSVWPLVWTTVWPRVCSVCPMVWTMSGQSGQWWPKSARSGQYLSLGIVGLANACFGYGRSGQYLSWVADFILGCF